MATAVGFAPVSIGKPNPLCLETIWNYKNSTTAGYQAVGAAVGLNPLLVIVPCHRVIGSHGDLTGFGGGLDTKEALLRLEAEHSQFPNVP